MKKRTSMNCVAWFEMYEEIALWASTITQPFLHVGFFLVFSCHEHEGYGTTGNLFNLIERERENGTNADFKLSWRFTQVHVHILHEAIHRFHVTRVIRCRGYLRNRVRFHALFVEPNDFYTRPKKGGG